jgi:hypothetical protein
MPNTQPSDSTSHVVTHSVAVGTDVVSRKDAAVDTEQCHTKDASMVTDFVNNAVSRKDAAVDTEQCHTKDASMVTDSVNNVHVACQHENTCDFTYDAAVQSKPLVSSKISMTDKMLVACKKNWNFKNSYKAQEN